MLPNIAAENFERAGLGHFHEAQQDALSLGDVQIMEPGHRQHAGQCVVQQRGAAEIAGDKAEAIMAIWHLKRVKHLYDGLLEMEIRNNSRRDEPIHPFALRSESYLELSRIDRHRNVLQRTYERSMAELKRLQAERADEEPEEDCRLQIAE